MKRVALALIAVLGCADDDSSPVARGNVTVHVLRDELPIDGADIVLHDAYGRVLGTARSNTLGLATAEIEAGGMVTVLDPEFDLRLTTVTRVAIGSTLEIPLVSAQAVGNLIHTITIDAPTTPPPAETAAYTIQTPCGNETVESLPTTIALPAGCGPGSPMLIVARTAAQRLAPGRSLAYVSAKIGDDSRARPLAWSTACAHVALDTDVEMSLQLWPRFGNHAFRWLDLNFCTAEPPAQPTVDFGEGVVAHAVAYVDGSPQRTTSMLHDFMSLPTFLQIKARTDLLSGSIAALDFDDKGASWTSDPALAAADVIDATLTWSISGGDYVAWRMVLAPDALGTNVPEIPDSMNTWGTLDHATDVTLELRYADADWLDDLAAVHRELPLMLGGATSLREIPRGSLLREFVQKLYPN